MYMLKYILKRIGLMVMTFTIIFFELIKFLQLSSAKDLKKTTENAIIIYDRV